MFVSKTISSIFLNQIKWGTLLFSLICFFPTSKFQVANLWSSLDLGLANCIHWNCEIGKKTKISTTPRSEKLQIVQNTLGTNFYCDLKKNRDTFLILVLTFLSNIYLWLMRQEKLTHFERDHFHKFNRRLNILTLFERFFQYPIKSWLSNCRTESEKKKCWFVWGFVGVWSRLVNHRTTMIS